MKEVTIERFAQARFSSAIQSDDNRFKKLYSGNNTQTHSQTHKNKGGPTDRPPQALYGPAAVIGGGGEGGGRDRRQSVD